MPPIRIHADEEFLLAGCLQQDLASLEKFTSDYGVPLYSFLQSVLGKRADICRNFLTESMVEFLRSSAAFNLSEPIRVSLVRTLLEKIQKNLQSKDAEGPVPGWDERSSVLFECLCRLSWEDRVLLLLRDQLEFSLEEMESVVSKHKDKIRSGLKEARIKLREHLFKVLHNKTLQEPS